jgi:kynurenine formamidase
VNPLSDWNVVDLSVPLDERLPVNWPGHALFHHHVANTHAETPGGPPAFRGPYRTHTIVMDEHSGTHFDAPTHFIPPPGSGLPHAGPAGEISGDRIPLDTFMGPAAVIDCRDLEGSSPGESPIIAPEHIARSEAAHGAIEHGAVALLWTGWTDKYFQPLPAGESFAARVVGGSAPGWPAPDVPAAKYLHDRGVRLVVIDAPSIGAAHNGAPVHWWGLANGMVFVEGSAGFGKLPPRGAFYVFLPVKIAGSTGGPGRALAFVPPR